MNTKKIKILIKEASSAYGYFDEPLSMSHIQKITLDFQSKLSDCEHARCPKITLIIQALSSIKANQILRLISKLDSQRRPPAKRPRVTPLQPQRRPPAKRPRVAPPQPVEIESHDQLVTLLFDEVIKYHIKNQLDINNSYMLRSLILAKQNDFEFIILLRRFFEKKPFTRFKDLIEIIKSNSLDITKYEPLIIRAIQKFSARFPQLSKESKDIVLDAITELYTESIKKGTAESIDLFYFLKPLFRHECFISRIDLSIFKESELLLARNEITAYLEETQKTEEDICFKNIDCQLLMSVSIPLSLENIIFTVKEKMRDRASYSPEFSLGTTSLILEILRSKLFKSLPETWKHDLYENIWHEYHSLYKYTPEVSDGFSLHDLITDSTILSTAPPCILSNLEKTILKSELYSQRLGFQILRNIENYPPAIHTDLISIAITTMNDNACDWEHNSCFPAKNDHLMSEVIIELMKRIGKIKDAVSIICSIALETLNFHFLCHNEYFFETPNHMSYLEKREWENNNVFFYENTSLLTEISKKIDELDVKRREEDCEECRAIKHTCDKCLKPYITYLMPLSNEKIQRIFWRMLPGY